MEWLEKTINQLPEPSGEALSYLEYRGMLPETIKELNLKIWNNPPVPSAFSKTYGPRGAKLGGMIVVPLYTPRGKVLGFEARSVKKDLFQYRLLNSKWNPAFIGLNHFMPLIWSGAKIWIVEGLYDYAVLRRTLSPDQVVLATLRAAMTRRHINFLARFSKSGVRLAYDNDPPGRAAILGDGKKRGLLHSLRRNGVSLVEDHRYLGKDPADLWLKGKDQALKENFGGLLW